MNVETRFLAAVVGVLALALLVIIIEQVRAHRRHDRALSRIHGEIRNLRKSIDPGSEPS